MASTIGIKIANGEFYPLLEEGSEAKKRLILTTVHNNQESVQIDLYKSNARTMADSVYIGSLVIENIGSRPRGEPSIEMKISSSNDGNINAEAVDMDSGPNGEHQYLSVSLKSLGDAFQEYDIPDFELENDSVTPPMGLYENEETVKPEKPSRSNKAAVIIAIIVGLLILAAGVFYLFFWGKDIVDLSKFGSFFSGKDRPAQEQLVQQPVQVIPPPREEPVSIEVVSDTPQEIAVAEPQETLPVEQLVVQQVEETPPAPEPPPPAPPPIVEAPPQAPAPAEVSRGRPAPPVASYAVPSVIPKDGAPYRVRYGDTLWDIAAAFYRNPLLYMRIARFNNIRNPDRLISGRTIRIPPRN